MGRLEEIKNKTEQYGWYTHKIVTIDDVEWLIDEVEKRENYWVDKHLETLGENIKRLQEIEQLKELVTKTNKQNLHLNNEIKELQRDLAIKEEDYYNMRDQVNRLKENFKSEATCQEYWHEEAKNWENMCHNAEMKVERYETALKTIAEEDYPTVVTNFTAKIFLRDAAKEALGIE